MFKKTERVNLYVITELFSMENGRMTKNMANELKLIKIELYTKVILLMVIKIERAHLHNKIN